MKAIELKKKYIEFFKSKGHKEIRNTSLIPENDPTVLFTTAGMHPLVPYLIGQKHPLGKRLVNIQRCIRTGDIEGVGDEFHNTFFEMLGNWSLGDYFKKEAIEMSFEFLTKWLKIPVEKLGITVFKGDKDASMDEESIKVWLSLGISKERIAYMGKEDNWWGPVGLIGPCGPDTEMFYWIGKEKAPKIFDPKDKKWIEIWNDVFIGYEKTADGRYVTLKHKNVDTGMGVERTTAVLQGKESVYDTELFLPIMGKIEEISKYDNIRSMRIIADHLRAAVFVLGDENNIVPSNIEQGYVLRRLIRNAIRHGRLLGIQGDFTNKIAEVVIDNYSEEYVLFIKKKKFILEELQKEETKFKKTLTNGLRQFEKFVKRGNLSGKDAFVLFSTYGFPLEMTEELVKEHNVRISRKEFEEEFMKHQELSRTATKGRFSSGLADNSLETTRLHTATHLLHSALRRIFGNGVQQKGSNITSERLRFDFSFDRKLTKDEIKKVEDLVNQQIKKELKVTREEMSPSEAKRLGALGFFEHKYGEKISVYTVGDFSKEICTGPHVKNTGELGRFKIVKEEGIAAGIRRIKAILE